MKIKITVLIIISLLSSSIIYAQLDAAFISKTTSITTDDSIKYILDVFKQNDTFYFNKNSIDFAEKFKTIITDEKYPNFNDLLYEMRRQQTKNYLQQQFFGIDSYNSSIGKQMKMDFVTNTLLNINESLFPSKKQKKKIKYKAW
ncbi:MAG: hypothetical protein LBQ28_07300 [Prevotellaceae bacterium]|jgi:hypothetical protein|nr:hypothetical protein [Prevotellaceae bacterium]